MARLATALFEQHHLPNHHASVDCLDHVIDGEQGDLNCGERLHFNPRLARDADCGPAAYRRRFLLRLETNRDTREGKWVTERDQFAGLLGGLNGSDSRNAQHIALVCSTRLNLLKGLGSHLDHARGRRLTSRVRLGGHIHHMGLTPGIKMIQFLCHALIIALLVGGMRPARAEEPRPPRPLSEVTASLPALGEAAVDELSPAAERRLGQQVFSQVQAAGMVHDDPEATDYLTAQASRLVQAAQARGDLLASSLKPEDFRFFWVREDSINAFALPGGWIGVHTGLLTRAANEAELMSVIAHEIAHVTQRHIARQMGQSRQSMAVFLATAILAAAAAGQSSDAAIGLMTLGETLALRSQLSFSRDAEREADRLGFSLMQASGFDPSAMSSLFEKLSQAGRFYDDSAPVWLRSHPLSSERLSEAQLRLSQIQRVQVPSGPALAGQDSLEFRLIRARLFAQSGRDLERSRANRARLVLDLQQAISARDQATAWYGQAWAALTLKDPQGARQALERARLALVGSPDADPAAPLLARLEQAIAFDLGQYDRVIELSDAASGLWALRVSARAMARQRAEAQLLQGRPSEAVLALTQITRRWPSDTEAWKLLARAYSADRKPAMAHWATAESYALLGAYGAAVDQINLARRAEGADFQALLQMDARLAAFRAALKDQDPSGKQRSSDR